MKNKKKKRFKPFDIGAYELFHNGLYKQKIIPNKKKTLQLKRKKVDIRDYQPFLYPTGGFLSVYYLPPNPKFLLFHHLIRQYNLESNLCFSKIVP